MKWSQLDEELLKSCNNRKTLKQAAEILRRSESSVKHKAYNMGIKFKSEKVSWSKKEENFLIKNYYTMTYEDLAKYLHRSIDAVKHKAYMLNLQYERETDSREWTDWETQYIEKMYHKKGVPYIAKRLDRSIYSVKRKAQRMGLAAYGGEYASFRVLSESFNSNISVFHRWKDKYDMPCVPVKRGDVTCYNVDISEFWKWAKNHKDIIPWSKYVSLSLLPEPDFVKEEVKKCSMINHRKRIPNNVKQSIIHEYERGKSINELALEYGRSINSIKHVLRNRNKRK